MSEKIEVGGWFVSGIDVSDTPTSLSELRQRYRRTPLTAAQLRQSPKWEPLIRGEIIRSVAGWVPLSHLAATRRGIATGANGFFLLNQSHAHELGLASDVLVGCIGRSKDVAGAVFSSMDLDSLRRCDVRCLLLDIKREPTEHEKRYLRRGEDAGLLSRYILANRRPWYSMEQREPAPIWAAVFGRNDLGFVHNEAGARSLTNFHCIYPTRTDLPFIQALTVTLNSRVVQAGSRSHSRGYGGGLKKFEPNDLHGIQVPDLRQMTNSWIERLASYLQVIDEVKRKGERRDDLYGEIDELISSSGKYEQPLSSLL